MATYRLTAQGTLPGETFNFGLHVSGAGGSASTAVSDFVAALGAMWTDATDGLQTHYTSNVAIVVGHAAELDPLTNRQVDAAEAATNLPGTDATGTMLPHECAVAITTRGAAANRKDRGRFYLPPPSTLAVLNGRLTTANVGHFVHAAAILMNSLQGSSYTPVILHRDLTTTAIVEVDCGDVIDSQRRRRNKLIEVRQLVTV